ncbi:MAG: hypothetical protein COT74_04515 [Bdellovibrionales bacterium CG10_big_fil_rev_8_21_14_0_10_45_34]|nr:MAG: hypothetical protein COT74_04515 [Bdellovibrionales bacterium CG10_big_fil_rev_8_21_14_0_10_45_34]
MVAKPSTRVHLAHKENFNEVVTLLLGLTLLVLTATVTRLLTSSNVSEIASYAVLGWHSLFGFTMQMVLVFVAGHCFASTPVVSRLITFLSAQLVSPVAALAVLNLSSFVFSYLNWALGLVASALFAKQISARHKDIPPSLILTAAYSGFIVWHGGLSGSIPLSLNTAGHIVAEHTGLIGLSDTIFSSLNIVIVLGLAFLFPLIHALLLKRHSKLLPLTADKGSDLSCPSAAPHFVSADFSQAKPLQSLPFWIGVLMLGTLTVAYSRSALAIDLNFVIYVGFAMSAILTPSIFYFVKNVQDAALITGAFLIQYPIYSMIMKIMVGSGLAALFAERMSAWPTGLLEVGVFLFSGFINLFIPSGGGQWVAQATWIVELAKQHELSISRLAMAVAWGDAWTNLIQPFFALPILIYLKIPITVAIRTFLLFLAVSGAWISLCFLLL